MPVKDLPSRNILEPSDAATADRLADNATEFLRKALESLGPDNNWAIGTVVIAAQMNLLAERMAEKCTYCGPLTRELKHADMLWRMMSEVMNQAVERQLHGRK